jgi:hypothetical protein
LAKVSVEQSLVGEVSRLGYSVSPLDDMNALQVVLEQSVGFQYLTELVSEVIVPAARVANFYESGRLLKIFDVDLRGTTAQHVVVGGAHMFLLHMP